jgi:hypothetical protein
MSFLKHGLSGNVSMFPTEFVKKCIKTLQDTKGYTPNTIAINKEDHIDYTLTGTIGAARGLGLNVRVDLKVPTGAFDLELWQESVEPATK